MSVQNIGNHMANKNAKTAKIESLCFNKIINALRYKSKVCNLIEELQLIKK